MEIHSLIRSLRLKHGLSQHEVSKDIMSRSAYSRFELGDRALTSSEFDLIMTRLDAQVSDLNDIENLENPLAAQIRQLVQDYLNHTLDLKHLEKLYLQLKHDNNKSMRVYRNYLFLKHQFNHVLPIIEPITTEEIDRLFLEIKNKNHLTNYYLQLIADFTPYFSKEHLIYFFETLEKYPVEFISALDCQYLHVFPTTISNITDALIDLAVLDKNKPDQELLAYAKASCDKLSQILKISPLFNYNLLLSLFRIRIAFYQAQTKAEKSIALEKARTYQKEVKFIANMRNYEGNKIQTTADIVLYSLNNLITTGMPGKVAYFID